MHAERFPSWLVLALAATALACQPEIGDPCTLPSDCSVNGDRLCDPTFPGGYCTQFNCEPGKCPDEAVCVAYRGVNDDVTGTCGETRFRRTFCMKSCDDNKDCREEEGYQCMNAQAVPAWSAVVVENGAFNPRICAPPYSGAPLSAPPPVCTATSDGGFPDVLVPEYPSGRSDAGSDAASSDATTRDAAERDATREGGPITDVASRGDSSVPADASIDGGALRSDAAPRADARE